MLKNKEKKSHIISNGLTVFYAAAILGVCYTLTLSDGRRLQEIIFDRGPIPHTILIASAWALAILVAKRRNMKSSGKHHQEIQVFTEKIHKQFSNTVNNFDLRQKSEIDKSLNWLSESREKKRISLLVRDCLEVSPEFALKRAQIFSDLDAQDAANGYKVPQVLAWAVPMLGFLGTVWGIAQSLSSFTGIMGDVDNVSHIKEGLSTITGGLGIAFDTTLLGIFFAIIITGAMAYLQRRENKLLNQFDRTALGLLKTLSIRESDPQSPKIFEDLEKHTKALVAIAKQTRLTVAERNVLENAARSISELGACANAMKTIAEASRDLAKTVNRLNRPKEFRIIEDSH